MVEKSVALARQRKASELSSTADVDLSDKTHCILCYNDMTFFALGRCNHKNVCHNCILRLRFIMKDKKCPICKTECEEMFIAETQSLTFEQLNRPDVKKKLLIDKEDSNIHYENEQAKKAGS